MLDDILNGARKDIMNKVLSFFKRYKLYILVVPVLCVCFFLFPNKEVGSSDVVVEEETIEKIEEEILEPNVEPVIEMIYVDVKGCVQNPGVYQLDKNSRVVDAILASGGVTSIADTSNINLSKRLVDEMVIVVSSHEELEKKEVKDIEISKPLIGDSAISKEEVVGGTVVSDDSVVGDVPILGSKISINTATMLQLQSLPGVGESKALSIVEYRKEKPFEKIEDLLNVSGIGEALFEQIKEYITI